MPVHHTLPHRLLLLLLLPLPLLVRPLRLLLVVGVPNPLRLLPPLLPPRPQLRLRQTLLAVAVVVLAVSVCGFLVDRRRCGIGCGISCSGCRYDLP